MDDTTTTSPAHVLAECERNVREHELFTETINTLVLFDEEIYAQTESAAKKVTISNVVCTFSYCKNLACDNPETSNTGQLTLWKLTMLSRGLLSYNPSSFAAAVCNFNDPSGSVLLFQSGKAVVAGAKSIKSANLLARRFCHEMYLMGVRNGNMYNFKIQNLVAVANLQQVIDLSLLQESFSAQVSYNPCLFPGARLRLTKLRSSAGLSIFRNGSVVITGASSEPQIFLIWHFMQRFLMFFVKQNLPPQRSDDYFADQNAQRDEMLNAVTEVIRQTETKRVQNVMKQTKTAMAVDGVVANDESPQNEHSEQRAGDAEWLEHLCLTTGLRRNVIEIIT
jgi:TATA-box binding protein (TBP) (component of TFIID and TFIIIB)